MNEQLAKTVGEVLIRMDELGLFVSYAEGRYILTEIGQGIINEALKTPDALRYHDELISKGVPRQIVRLAILLAGAAVAYAGKPFAELAE